MIRLVVLLVINVFSLILIVNQEFVIAVVIRDNHVVLMQICWLPDQAVAGRQIPALAAFVKAAHRRQPSPLPLHLLQFLPVVHPRSTGVLPMPRAVLPLGHGAAPKPPLAHNPLVL